MRRSYHGIEEEGFEGRQYSVLDEPRLSSRVLAPLYRPRGVHSMSDPSQELLLPQIRKDQGFPKEPLLTLQVEEDF